MSRLIVNQIQGDAVSKEIEIPSGHKLKGAVAGGIVQPGGIIQVQYMQYTSTMSQAFSANSYQILNFGNVTITPTSTTSKIHLQAHIMYEHGDNNNTSWNHTWFFWRDSTRLSHADAGSRNCGISMGTLTYYADDSNSTPEVVRYDYFDEPNTTSQVTYKVGYRPYNAESLRINSTYGNADGTGHERGISFMSATEISA